MLDPTPLCPSRASRDVSHTPVERATDRTEDNPIGWHARLRTEGDSAASSRSSSAHVHSRVIAELAGEHLVLSTSVRNGGQVQGIRYLGNHQSCEGAGHIERHDFAKALGQEGYHDVVCREIGLPAAEVASMGTAANMNYAAIATHEDREVVVTAMIAAGGQGNATCAGDPAGWREGENGWEKVNGTINTMLLINHPLTEGAMARAVVPGPNSGWSEATAAGAIQRKLAGPIWANGPIVTEVWLGDPGDPPAGREGDFRRSAILVTTAGLAAVAIAIAALFPAYL